jgi:hypothetical protein
MFTPMNEQLTERLKFDDSQVVWLSGRFRRGPGLHGIVKIAGTRYEVHGLDCGSPSCFCDAYIVPLPEL